VASRRSESLPECRAAAAVRHAELRQRLHLLLFDESGVNPAGTAIYSLADPREARLSRYIGQTAQPPRRLMQHLCTARLWLADETPWWITTPQLRPLYHWIRDLYSEEGRLPVMIVHAWIEARRARLAEREHIRIGLERGLPLLNVAICQMPDAAEAATR
jgi:hypothetical protein